MSAELPEVFILKDSSIGTYVVENFRRFRESGLFLDVTINVGSSSTALFISLLDR